MSKPSPLSLGELSKVFLMSFKIYFLIVVIYPFFLKCKEKNDLLYLST